MLPNVTFARNASIALEALRDLFAHTDWAKSRALRDLERMLRQTSVHVSAWQGERLVGFARALSDGVFRAIIEDVVVAPPGRGAGVGKKLVELLLLELREVEEIMLGCMEELAPFYERFEFKRVSHPIMKRHQLRT